MKSAFCFQTRLGKVVIVENGTAVVQLCFGENISEDSRVDQTPLLKRAHRELEEYLSGQRKNFDLPLAPQGTDFQKKVWVALQNIPYGKKCSYKDIAIAVGNEKASRAVGGANHLNPIAILIPCHRVIGSNGNLTGYAGGVDFKEKLLELESRYDG
ncbi:methylated-DNA--[protein]-cysteine S-methyltransferase [Acetobacterium fimetarium]|uniref:Methylated-DNA--protein-cysteine methyltransferase n=1 Tax=Acetobacterium fimetarium TaxID=52691 RepID=A0ABR6WXU9_9FIRM|nr:methylated-DNA--[protein]-cysteine S-methyltransferase [Acetobacterium fimetarium]MBC3805474.1 methylated-DNA--[protein]-cysteine S-methyltransferase [Acetobacterium fimetarium]